MKRFISLSLAICMAVSIFSYAAPKISAEQTELTVQGQIQEQIDTALADVSIDSEQNQEIEVQGQDSQNQPDLALQDEQIISESDNRETKVVFEGEEQKAVSQPAEYASYVYQSVSADKQSPQQDHTQILLKANVSGVTSGLQYKFVWMTNNWQEWGVLRDFSSSGSYSWTPQKAGDYTIYVDLKDQSGAIETKTLPYQITAAQWNYDSISVNKQSPQEKNTTIQIKANTTGVTSGLQYKFVWMTNNWKEWGVIRDFSLSNTYNWTPSKAGSYKLYVDVRDNNGKIITKTIDYKIVSALWNYQSVSANLQAPQPDHTQIQLKANVSGTTGGLQYKFVWMTNDWEQWGVIRDFSSSSVCNWTPDRAGNYTIYVDVKDQDDDIVTKTLSYQISPASWSYSGISANLRSPQAQNTSIQFTANVAGTVSGLQYKFVWMKNNWNEWGVFRDFGASNTAVFTPSEGGDYTIYIDVKDNNGQQVTKTTPFGIWENVGVSSSVGSTVVIGNSVELMAMVNGPQEGLQYKFVWMTNNWSDWGVIRDFSTHDTANWTPPYTGNFKIYLDMKDQTGKIITSITEMTVKQPLRIEGIDVSSWQGTIDWKAVKNSGVQFAMIRSGYGRNELNQVDKQFYNNVKGAKAVGMDIGVYHYSYADSPEDAVREAEFCLEIIKGNQYTYPIVFDIEDPSLRKLGKRTLTDICIAFCERIEQAGYYAAIYTNQDWLDNYLYKDELLSRFDLWFAQWRVSSPSYSCGIWQYTDSGTVPGISGYVDKNIAYKDYPSIIRSAGLNGF